MERFRQPVGRPANSNNNKERPQQEPIRAQQEVEVVQVGTDAVALDNVANDNKRALTAEQHETVSQIDSELPRFSEILADSSLDTLAWQANGTAISNREAELQQKLEEEITGIDKDVKGAQERLSALQQKEQGSWFGIGRSRRLAEIEALKTSIAAQSDFKAREQVRLDASRERSDTLQSLSMRLQDFKRLGVVKNGVSEPATCGELLNKVRQVWSVIDEENRRGRKAA